MSGESINQSEKNELTEEQLGFQYLAAEVPFAGAITAKEDLEATEAEPRHIRLEDLNKVYSMDGYMLYGHGTGRAGTDHEIIKQIFSQGLRGYQSLDNMAVANDSRAVVGSTDLTQTAVGLWASSGDTPYDSAKLKDNLDHWKHLESENIILMRLPEQYFHAYTNIDAERFKPYFTTAPDPSGRDRYYLDRRFILGNYNSKTGLIELNDHFEPEIIGDFKEEMDNRLTDVKAETSARQARLEQIVPGVEKTTQEQSIYGSPELGDFDFEDWDDYSDEDWS